MTSAPRSPARPAGDLEAATAAVRRQGGRLSAPRRRVLEALFAADGPVSAEYLARGLDGRATPVELTSAYRSLEHLERLGLVSHVHLGHGPGLYALTRESPREYLVCERCDRVTTVPAARLDPLRTAIREAFGYHARFSHFPIVGLCGSCAEREDHSEATRPGGPMHHGDPTQDAHDVPHTHEHAHGGVTHAHPHTGHDHAHTEHEHEH